MVSGTTPTLIINANIGVDEIMEMWVTFSNTLYKELLTKKLSDCVIAENQLLLKLSQEDTISLNPNNSEIEIYVQIRVLTKNDIAFASKIYKLPISKLLKEGIIYAHSV